MQILLLILGSVLLLLLVGAIFIYVRMKRYLAQSKEGIESTVSEIAEEIDSYQEKTQ